MAKYKKKLEEDIRCPLAVSYTHLGEEIPEDVPAIEYYDYILKNFRNPKPKEEWTDVDYKACLLYTS